MSGLFKEERGEALLKAVEDTTENSYFMTEAWEEGPHSDDGFILDELPEGLFYQEDHLQRLNITVPQVLTQVSLYEYMGMQNVLNCAEPAMEMALCVYIDPDDPMADRIYTDLEIVDNRGGFDLQKLFRIDKNSSGLRETMIWWLSRSARDALRKKLINDRRS
ncbi:MAG: hypothetical protein V6Z81_06465 [Parvularculales bacterium]